MQNLIISYEQLRSDHMKELELKQVLYEKETWKRLMSFMTEENICLKNRLSDVLKDPFNNNLLEQLECFQTRFLKADKLMDLLRRELAELEELLARRMPQDDYTMTYMRTKLMTLRNFVSNAEREFIKLKLDFNCFLSENI